MSSLNALFRRGRLLGLIAVFAIMLAALPDGARPARAAASELFFSEYIEGSSNNKALEIFNGTGAAVNLTTGGYNVQMYFNGSASAGLTINLNGTVTTGDVFVVAQSSANATILAQADQTNGSGWFNGDDAVVLRKGTIVIDAIGQVGFDPGTEWGTGLTSSADNTLRRKATLCQGDTNSTDVFDPSVEWDGFALDTFDGLGSHTSNCGDTPPTVTGTDPTSGATNVARDANITITFNEAVNVTGSWFDITCATSGAHTATVSGGPTTFTLDPDANFAANEACTVMIFAAQVTDQDADDPPDNMAANFSFSFRTIEVLVCGDPATLIHSIQGSSLLSPLNGATVTIEGIVIGDYQGSGQFSGYHIQEEDADADADPATSEGIFVFNTSFPVNAGDKVRVSGRVTEFETSNGSGAFLTELGNVTSVVVCSNGNSVTPTTVTLPVSSLNDWERYESMLISITQDLVATENFTLGRFGEVSLSVGDRLRNPTNIVAPGAPAIARQDLNNRSRILLDDANGQQNVDPIRYPEPAGLSASNTLRSGYTVHSLTGVLEQRFSVYRIQPVGPISFDASTNPRVSAPEPVGGNTRVAALNVLNFFTTLDTGSSICGPSGGLDCRGANSAFEFTRQRDKIINSILAIDPDAAGLMEVQNDGSTTIQNLVDGLNAIAGAGTYAYINTGTIGTDAIKVAIIYKPAAVTPVGPYAILDSSVDPQFIDTKNRPSLAQTFMRNTTGAKLTLVVNHLKSKGSACDDVGDPDTGDGQGNCNLTRTKAATALVNWLATDPTASGDPDFLIVGDMNSYAKENPITTITSAGYTNLLAAFLGAGAYSYVFDGQSGYLDHALASTSLAAQATGVTEWHNNADEPTILDYNVEFKSAGQVSSLYNSEPFRASDHDPVIVGLNLPTPPTAPIANDDSYAVDEDATLTVVAPGVLDNDTDANNDTLSAALVSGPSHGMLTLNPNGSFTYTPAANYYGPDSFTYKASDGAADSNVATVSITVNPVNDAPTAANDSYTTAEDVPLTGNVLANDIDVENETLTAALVSGPSHGMLTLNPNGSFTYTPAANYYGPDSFTYKANDGAADSNVATVSITVTSVNDAPTIAVAEVGQCLADFRGQANLSVDDVETAPGGLTLSGSSSNTTLVPNANITFGGSGANRTVTITTAPGKSGSATVTILVNDGTTTAMITIGVKAGTSNNDSLTGSSGSDMLFAGNAQDTLNGGDGNDLLCSGQGDDTLNGGLGADTLDGGSGQDTLNGGEGNDTLRGGQGDDRLTGGSGADRFDGGPGNDTATDFNAGEGDTKTNIP